MNMYFTAVFSLKSKFFLVVTFVFLTVLSATVLAETHSPSAPGANSALDSAQLPEPQGQASQGLAAAEKIETVNINAATPATLASQLKGIGPSKAAAIVQYREAHGAFATVDALVNVKGIGVKTIEKLRNQLVAGPFSKPEKGESLIEQEAAAQDAVQSIVKRSLQIRRAVGGQD